ncbi:MAG TPA: hypothetical protein VGJ90_11480 [Methylophilaceae bacterium]|jgi:hypothetical protein
MGPLTIFGAIQAADLAVDAAIKVKNHFFSSKSADKTETVNKAEISVTIETLQAEVNIQKQKLAEVTAEVADNRAIIQEQNEIIIELSNALKVTAETAQKLRVFTFIFALLSVVAIFVAGYVLIR